MKAERLILSIVFIALGLLVAGGVFYLFQMTKVIPDSQLKTPSAIIPTPTPDESGNLLILENPADESVTDKKLITISGRTTPDALLIVTTAGNDQVIKPTTTGTFTLTQTIDTGSNLIEVRAIYPDGTEKRITRTITFSTESF